MSFFQKHLILTEYDIRNFSKSALEAYLIILENRKESVIVLWDNGKYTVVKSAKTLEKLINIENKRKRTITIKDAEYKAKRKYDRIYNRINNALIKYRSEANTIYQKLRLRLQNENEKEAIRDILLSIYENKIKILENKFNDVIRNKIEYYNKFLAEELEKIKEG